MGTPAPRRTATLAVLLALLAALVGATPAPAQALPVASVRIGATTYAAVDPVALTALLPKSTPLKAVLTAVKACRGARVLAFASTRPFGAGVVAWLPAELIGCLTTSGGGPTGGGPGSTACLSAYTTPASTDPTGVSGGRADGRRSYVLIGATTATACTDLTTQVPGGVWARTNAAVAGRPAGSVVLIKCQLRTTAGLFDLLSTWSPSLPASKATSWADDRFVGTDGDRLDGVPGCRGGA